MEEAKITISINPKQLERLAYWIVIAGLAVLLILSFLKDDACDPSKTASGEEDEDAAAAPTTPTPTTPTATAASCSDGIKNQDETDIDCGGAKCNKCIAGKACAASGDCISTFCTANVCTASAPVTLSGKVELDVTKAYTTKSPTGTAKVTGIDYKVTNGQDEDLDGYVIKIFIKNKAGTRCLNQETPGTCEETYVEFSGASVKSGKTAAETKMFEDGWYTTTQGRYLIEDNGYDPSDSSLDDIQVVAYLYDSNGDAIDGKTITDTISVSP